MPFPPKATSFAKKIAAKKKAAPPQQDDAEAAPAVSPAKAKLQKMFGKSQVKQATSLVGKTVQFQGDEGEEIGKVLDQQSDPKGVVYAVQCQNGGTEYVRTNQILQVIPVPGDQADPAAETNPRVEAAVQDAMGQQPGAMLGAVPGAMPGMPGVVPPPDPVQILKKAKQHLIENDPDVKAAHEDFLDQSENAEHHFGKARDAQDAGDADMAGKHQVLANDYAKKAKKAHDKRDTLANAKLKHPEHSEHAQEGIAKAHADHKAAHGMPVGQDGDQLTPEQIEEEVKNGDLDEDQAADLLADMQDPDADQDDDSDPDADPDEDSGNPFAKKAGQEVGKALPDKGDGERTDGPKPDVKSAIKKLLTKKKAPAPVVAS
jgi:hypothetical protein